MTRQDTTVSVCIPTRNRPDMLRQCIQSVLDQTTPAREIVIGDDSDDDRTDEVVRDLELPSTIDVTYVRNSPPLGQARNVERIFASAGGQWLLLLHDDDWLMPDAIENLLSPLCQQPGIDVVYGRQLIASDSGQIDYGSSENVNHFYCRDHDHAGFQPNSMRSAILQQFPNDGFLVRANLARQVGYHRNDVKDGSDFVFGLNLALAGAKLYCVDRYTAVYRISTISNQRSGGASRSCLEAVAATRACLHILDHEDDEVRERLRNKLYRAVVWCGLHRTRRLEALRWAISPRWGLRWWRREGLLAAAAVVAPGVRQKIRGWLRPTDEGPIRAERGERETSTPREDSPALRVRRRDNATGYSLPIRAVTNTYTYTGRNLMIPLCSLKKKWFLLVQNASRHCKFLGVGNGLIFFIMSYFGLELSKKVRIGDVELYMRTSSPDLGVAVKTIIDGEYSSIKCRSPRTIVDAGAYIGVSSIFFARKYPEATIIAIEPDEENYALLLKNIRAYRNVIPLNAALWKDDCTRALVGRHTGQWGYTIVDTLNETSYTGQEVRCITLNSVMEKFSADHVDVLKLDIEGAEGEVFQSSASWIDKVGSITVELHDRICDGCSAAFRAATADFDHFEESGEKVTAYRIRDVGDER